MNMQDPAVHRLATQGILITGELQPSYQAVLTPDALAFVAHLARRYTTRVQELLARRQEMQAKYDAGAKPDFLPETRHVRESEWKVGKLPTDLLDRRVEITGPTDRKMVINALNSGANVFMADFEDSNAPTWHNMVQGQMNMRDAVRGTITFEDPKTGKAYRLNPKTAVLLVRPRGWHLWEKHMRVDGRPVPAGLFDFGLYFWHNAHAQLERGSGPYFYLPKMQSYLEARLWNDVFCESQARLGLARGTIKATVLIETLPAAFQMDEILHELRDHSAGLNCGRWDYIFSLIKTLREHPDSVLPDRSLVGMDQHCMRSYTQLLIKTCHRRGVHAMGGMAAQIPIKNDDRANQAAMEKVKTDKLREVTDGHDGTWVAHPGLIKIAKDIFDRHMPGPNQLNKLREDVHVTAADLLRVPQGPRTEAGLRSNISVGVQYLEAWLGGNGCVPLYNMMEDAATAEISRVQVWQWIRHHATLDDGKPMTVERFMRTMDEEMAKICQTLGPERFTNGHFHEARMLFSAMITARQLGDFLTLPAYELLGAPTAAAKL